MRTEEVPLISFLHEVMRRKSKRPSQMAAELGISHATVSRWLSGKDIPSPKSCRRLAEYTGVPLSRVLSIAGHLPQMPNNTPIDWPEFREYARRRYPKELDEDIITMIEDLIERRRGRGGTGGEGRTS